MRTTVNIDERLLAEAKLIAVREHRTIGSVLEDALRALIDQQNEEPSPTSYGLPSYTPSVSGLRTGVDLENKDQMADLLGDNELKAP